MFSKGRTNYQSMVLDKSESLKFLLFKVSEHINKIKEDVELN